MFGGGISFPCACNGPWRRGGPPASSTTPLHTPARVTCPHGLCAPSSPRRPSESSYASRRGSRCRRTSPPAYGKCRPRRASPYIPASQRVPRQRVAGRHRQLVLFLLYRPLLIAFALDPQLRPIRQRIQQVLVPCRREALNLLLQLQHPAAQVDVTTGELGDQRPNTVLLRDLRVRSELPDGDEDAARPSNELKEGLQQLLERDRFDPDGHGRPTPVRRNQRLNQLQRLRLDRRRFEDEL